jgi:hypothetical protein
MLRILAETSDREAVTTDLDAIVREGARRMLLSTARPAPRSALPGGACGPGHHSAHPRIPTEYRS